jgi:hypothetical protein
MDLGMLGCPDCVRLLEEHYRLRTMHSIAFQAVRYASEDPLPVGAYRALMSQVNEAWIDLEVARIELEQHQRWHEKA